MADSSRPRHFVERVIVVGVLPDQPLWVVQVAGEWLDVHTNTNAVVLSAKASARGVVHFAAVFDGPSGPSAHLPFRFSLCFLARRSRASRAGSVRPASMSAQLSSRNSIISARSARSRRRW